MMLAPGTGEVTISFSDLREVIRTREDTEIARSGDNTLRLSIAKGMDMLLMFSSPRWEIVTLSTSGEIVEVLEVPTSYFFYMTPKSIAQLSARAETLSARPC